MTSYYLTKNDAVPPDRPGGPVCVCLKHREGSRQRCLVRCGPPVENLAADGPNR
jgi:hypothetical protein